MESRGDPSKLTVINVKFRIFSFGGLLCYQPQYIAFIYFLPNLLNRPDWELTLKIYGLNLFMFYT